MDPRKKRFRDRPKQRSMDQMARDIASEAARVPQILKTPGRSQPHTRLRQRALADMEDEGYGPVAIGAFFHRSKKTVSHALKKFTQAP